jgi:hypothetical protein
MRTYVRDEKFTWRCLPLVASEGIRREARLLHASSVSQRAFVRGLQSRFTEYIMTSTLDPNLTPEPDRSLGKGHDAKSLGPSDVSDSGSDVQPGVRGIEERGIDLDTGTSEDADTRNIEVEGDSDSTGTGERTTAGRDSVEMGHDIGVDRIDQGVPGLDPDDEGLEQRQPLPSQRPDHRQHRRS